MLEQVKKPLLTATQEKELHYQARDAQALGWHEGSTALQRVVDLMPAALATIDALRADVAALCDGLRQASGIFDSGKLVHFDSVAYYQTHIELGHAKQLRDLLANPNHGQALLDERDQLRQKVGEPGSPEAIIEGLFEFAEQECGHNPASARHALTTVQKYVDQLTRERDAAVAVVRQIGAFPSTALTFALAELRAAHPHLFAEKGK